MSVCAFCVLVYMCALYMFVYVFMRVCMCVIYDYLESRMDSTSSFLKLRSPLSSAVKSSTACTLNRTYKEGILQ